MPAMNGLTAAQVLMRLMPKVPLVLYGCVNKLVKQRTAALKVAALISDADIETRVTSLARTLLAAKPGVNGPISINSVGVTA